MTSFDVKDPVDLFHVRDGVRRFARLAGFSARDAEELVIVASELASNILKYGVRGSVESGVIDDPRLGPGVELVARDRGPPFRDLALALQDGCDDSGPIPPEALLARKGIGAGLGAVVRLTDTFEVQPEPDGKRVRVVRYLRRPAANGASR